MIHKSAVRHVLISDTGISAEVDLRVSSHDESVNNTEKKILTNEECEI
jgi:hypothetical protein